MASERIALTKFETEVMSVLWRLGEATVRELQESIDRTDRPAYTTVQTIVQRLEQKGAVRRTRKSGSAFFFEPAITRKSVYRRLVEELLDLVGGSQPLVAHLVETGKLSLDDLKAVENTAKAAKRGRK
ncbi:MAG: BlaI family transcriptional regulator, penicillinase repressor [Thermoanaerobaculia bacterium]|jgi:predicted transcriptional regulator|nr:BlaI family transcriptional regulator, penicillinase repressor [Thermoanaerobaculia bacterium]